MARTALWQKYITSMSIYSNMSEGKVKIGWGERRRERGSEQESKQRLRPVEMSVRNMYMLYGVLSRVTPGSAASELMCIERERERGGVVQVARPLHIPCCLR